MNTTTAPVPVHIERIADSSTLTFGVDLDGTAGDFHGAFQAAVGKFAPERAARFGPLPKVYSYVGSGIYDEESVFMSDLLRASDEGVFRTLRPYEGFREGMRILDERGVNIKIVTSRPESAMDDTLHWLRHVAQVPFHSVTITHAKGEIPADVSVDDHPGHIDTFLSLNRTTLTFDQPYNRHSGGTRVGSWSEIVRFFDAQGVR